MLKKPQRRKYPKAHKGRNKYTVCQNKDFVYGQYGLISMEPGRISAAQIAAASLAIKRKLKREGKVWFRIFPHIPVTQKGAQVRMGKGKGAVHHWMTRVRAGSFLLELNAPNIGLARSALATAASKLPVRSKCIQR